MPPGSARSPQPSPQPPPSAAALHHVASAACPQHAVPRPPATAGPRKGQQAPHAHSLRPSPSLRTRRLSPSGSLLGELPETPADSSDRSSTRPHLAATQPEAVLEALAAELKALPELHWVQLAGEEDSPPALWPQTPPSSAPPSAPLAPAAQEFISSEGKEGAGSQRRGMWCQGAYRALLLAAVPQLESVDDLDRDQLESADVWKRSGEWEVQAARIAGSGITGNYKLNITTWGCLLGCQGGQSQAITHKMPQSEGGNLAAGVSQVGSCAQMSQIWRTVAAGSSWRGVPCHTRGFT